MHFVHHRIMIGNNIKVWVELAFSVKAKNSLSVNNSKILHLHHIPLYQDQIDNVDFYLEEKKDKKTTSGIPVRQR